jgi:hypothetical protein
VKGGREVKVKVKRGEERGTEKWRGDDLYLFR